MRHETEVASAPRGTYALILRSQTAQRVSIGRLGVLPVRPGYYIYVGSALGPGGLAARLRHHLAPAASPHWHVDYLRRVTSIEGLWYAVSGTRLEHEWARILAGTVGATVAMKGFGSSDCACVSHLFYFEAAPSTMSYLGAE